MSQNEELTALAREYHVDCAITSDVAARTTGRTWFTLTMATGEIERCASFEDACKVIRAYGEATCFAFCTIEPDSAPAQICSQIGQVLVCPDCYTALTSW